MPGFDLEKINWSWIFLQMSGFDNWNRIILPMPGFCIEKISWRRINLPMPGFGLVKINWSRIKKIHDTKDCSCDRSTARRRGCDKGQSLILQLNQKLFLFLALLYINLKTSSMIKGFQVKWFLFARYCKPSDSTPNNSNMILHNEIPIGNFRYDGI